MITLKNWTKVSYQSNKQHLCAIGHDDQMDKYVFVFELPYFYLIEGKDVPSDIDRENTYIRTVSNYKRLQYKCDNHELVEIITYKPITFDPNVILYNNDYNQVDMFFILNDIKSLCQIDMLKLRVSSLADRVYRVHDVSMFKSASIESNKIEYIYLVLDIEVRTIGCFPKANIEDNWVSHVTFVYSCRDKSYLKKMFGEYSLDMYIDKLRDDEPFILELSYDHSNPRYAGEYIYKRNKMIGFHITFLHEIHLLMYVKKQIETLEYDIISGYNSNGFDIKYISDRLEFLKCPPITMSVHQLFKPTSINPVATRSKNREVFNIKNGGGKIFFDLYIYMLKNRADLTDYKLNTVLIDYFTSDHIILERGKTTITISDEDIVENYGPDDVELIDNDIINVLDNETETIECDYIKVKNVFIRDLIDTSDHMYCKTYNMIMKVDDRTSDEYVYLVAPNIPECNTISLSYCKTELDIMKSYQLKDSHDKIGMYNIHDTNLTYYLLYRCNIDYVFKANADSTPMSPEEVLMYENSRTSSSLINKYIYDNKYFFPITDKQKEGKYAAALVLEARNKDRYSPIITHDFASLYPNVFIWGNLSYESKAAVMPFSTELDAQLAKEKLSRRLDKNNFNLVITRSSKDEPINSYKLEVFDTSFVGLLPNILSVTLSERDIEKGKSKKAKQEGRIHDAILHDYFQLNRKLRGNSIYGLMAFTEYTKSDPNLAQACTSIAYDMLHYLVTSFTCRYTVEYSSSLRVVSLIMHHTKSIYHPVIDELIYMPDIVYPNTKFYSSTDEDYYSVNTRYARVYFYKEYTSIVISKDLDNPSTNKISILTWIYNQDLIEYNLGLAILDLSNKYASKIDLYSRQLGCISIHPHKPKVDKSNTIVDYIVEPVYGDTDSVFLEHICDLPDQNSSTNLERLWFLGQLEQDLINHVLLFKPLNVKMEKIITHFRNTTKKKYSGCNYESLEEIRNGTRQIKTKGIKTRNKCKIHMELEDKCAEIGIECYDNNISVYETKGRITNHIINSLRERVKNISNFSGFIGSRKYTKSNNPDYIPNRKVEENNKTSQNQITEGSRYNYVYLVPANTPIGQKFNSTHELEHIVTDTDVTKKGYRLYIETYCTIILKDLSTNNNLEITPEERDLIFK
jgi:hypothetical protein